MLDLLAVRTTVIDQTCISFATSRTPEEQPQIVMLGAGYDTRAYRLSELSTCDVYEIDYPSVMATKTERLASSPARTLTRHHQLIGADLAHDSLRETLTAAGHLVGTNTPTLWVAEALTGYLSEPQCQSLFSDMHGLSGPHSAAIVTFVGATARAYGPTAPISTRHSFTTDAGALLLAQNGWIARQQRIGHYAAVYRREEALATYDYWIAQATYDAVNRHQESDSDTVPEVPNSGIAR